jgi:hypothetical protein
MPSDSIAPENEKELLKNVRGFLRGQQRQTHKATQYFQAKHVE